MAVFLVLLNMEVIVKKNIFLFLLMGSGLSMGFLGSTLNAMQHGKKHNKKHKRFTTNATQTLESTASTSTASAPANSGAVGNVLLTPVASTSTAPAPANSGAARNVLPAVASTSTTAEPANRRAVVDVLKKLLTVPWGLGESITSWVTNSTANAEPASKVLKRCVLEGLFCGIFLYLSSSGALGIAADHRLRLAGFAWNDFFSVTPFHYTCSRLGIAISGLQYLGTFLGLSGLRLGGWLLGVIIGLRCAYDSFIKLPLSFVSGVPKKPSSRYSFLRDDNDDI